MRGHLHVIYLLLAGLSAGGIFSFWLSGRPDRPPTDKERADAQFCFDRKLCYRCGGRLGLFPREQVRFQICDACAG